MKRIFSSPFFALMAGAALRLMFVWKFPGASGDTVLYEELATNWLKHGLYAMAIGGQLTPVDLRMPGYPAFLAMLYAVSRKTGENARLVVMLAQVLLDLGTCIVIAGLAILLARASASNVNYSRRVFTAAMWLAALCPFTANYVAVPLTETWALFFTTVALLIFAGVATRVGGRTKNVPDADSADEKRYWWLVALGGLTAGVGTLFRPETPLVVVTTCAALTYWAVRRGKVKTVMLTCLLMASACAVPLAPWTVRNAITLHKFQPLAPKDATIPGEVVPVGFMAWERTWLYRFRDCYLVPWKLNDEAIRMEDIPTEAFDTPEQRERAAAALEEYNSQLTWTAEQDAVFAQIARERVARRPLRTYVWIPLKRAVRIWFTPRIELLPVSGNVFPLRAMWNEDPVDQQVTIWFFLLNILYVALGLWGSWKLWKHRDARAAVSVMALYLLARTAFLTTLETPEPRYVLVCFPIVIACAAQVFGSAKIQSDSLG